MLRMASKLMTVRR